MSSYVDTCDTSIFNEIKNLPKVELHLHLEGSVKLDTIVDIAKDLHLPIPYSDDGVTPSKEGVREMFCITTKVENLAAFLDKMWNVQSLFSREVDIERIAYEACENAYINGVRLLELRFSPTFICLSRNNDHSHLTYEIVHNAVMKGINRAENDFDMVVGLIGILDRTVDVSVEEKVFEFYVNHMSDFVGIDMANDEHYSCLPFASIYERARPSFGLTCHAGESTSANSVREAVDYLNVTRIGHGFLSIHDSSVMTILLEKNIHLEICPLSNVLTGSVADIHSHPVKSLMNAGVKISINSDDPGMFDSTILDDYLLLYEHHGFTLEDFRACNMMALQASFIPLEKKEKIRLKYFQ
jgi:adenosine deaminase